MITIEIGKHTSRIYLPALDSSGARCLLSVSMDSEMDSREQRAGQRADARRLIESLAGLIREGHPVTTIYTESAQAEVGMRWRLDLE